jgi:hypothetical protein
MLTLLSCCRLPNLTLNSSVISHNSSQIDGSGAFETLFVDGSGAFETLFADSSGGFETLFATPGMMPLTVCPGPPSSSPFPRALLVAEGARCGSEA